MAEHKEEDPVIVASWLHHRFTQIHPYQDGNGRVARALTTMVLLRAGILPIVIGRDMRVEYIAALESADLGNLVPLGLIFARLERALILQALGVDADAEVVGQRALTSEVLNSLADRLARRKDAKTAELRHVNDVARRLRDQAREALQASFMRIRETIAAVQEEPFVQLGGPDRGNAHWYRFEVGASAREAGKFANFAEDHYFVKAAIRACREQLVFVTSFHHVGRELTGVMEATAFARLESFEDSDDREAVAGRFFECSAEPFVFTGRTDPEEIRDAFGVWLDRALAVAVKEYGDRL